MDIQGMVNEMNAQASRERANYHLTLGRLIEKLAQYEGKGLVVPLTKPHSYRGYYCDLAFEKGEAALDDFLRRCRAAVGEVFEGYKGGDYPMSKDTPLWVASYGCCGDALMDVSVGDGKVEITTKIVDA